MWLKTFLSTLWLLSTVLLNAQKVSGNYHFKSIENTSGKSLLAIDSADILRINQNLTFYYQLAAKNDLVAEGAWSTEGDILVFDYSQPSDTTRFYEILESSDSLLVIQEGQIIFSFIRDSYQKKEENKVGPPIFYSDGPLQPEHVLRGVFGLMVLLLISFGLSSNRRSIDWAMVFKGISLQLILAFLILKVSWVEKLFDLIGRVFVKILGFTTKGSEFLFGGFMDTDTYGYIFAFQVLPTIVFFSAITSLLYYYGVLQKVVWLFAWLMKKTLKLSGAESLAAAGNVFLGQTEAPLLVKPYIKNMTLSELLCLMSGGMATIAGAVLAAYIGFLGGPDELNQLYFAKHLLTASVMSAPAAIVASKMLLPETEVVNQEMAIAKNTIGDNWLDALSNGTTQGLKLAVNVGAMLLVFTAFIALVNSFLGDFIGEYTALNTWISDWTDGRYNAFSLEFIFGYTLAPLTWMMGVAKEDAAIVGQLLGEKTVLNEFYAYTTMSKMVANETFRDPRSMVIATYILCGFSNFASIGIQIGGIGVLAPNRRADLSRLGIKALIAGTLASLYTGVIVGMLI